MDPQKKSKLVVLACLIIPVLIGLFAYFGSQQANQEQVAEIKETIKQHGGIVERIEVVSYEQSPFEKSGKGNTIYKISYQVNGVAKTAWYRAHNQSSIVREEIAWIFD